MLVPRLARLSLLLLGLSASTDARMVTTVKRAAATNSSASAAAPANLNSSLSAVCTPTQCLQGANSLAAGTTIYTPVNSSSRATVLLPGTYTSSSSTTANSSLLTFGTSSTSFTAAGFSTTGTVGSTLSVSLLAGVTTYTGPLFQDTPTYTPLSASSASTNSTGSIESFLLSDNIWAVLTVGGSSGSRVVAWDGVADVGNLPGGSGGVVLEGFQSSTCSTPCASGGVCLGNSTCACRAGFTGATCNACATGLFGKTCEACPAGCTDCDDGITGTGMCLTTNTTTTAAVCNCANGVCASNSTTATCSCNAGWATASNGTQCAACASGYYMSSGGDCLACDPSCESCSSPSGTCLTCQSGLQPDSTDGTKCTTATTALTNGTFITCPSRTFFDSTNKTCVDCNPLCDTCFASGTGGCLTCRSPNGLLNGKCVAVDSSTGLCDSSGVVQNGSTTAVGSNAVWVFDNSKGECDALPAKCTAGAIDNFTSASTRSQLTCSACLAGSYLSNGACVSSCPTVTTVSSDGTSCTACDSSCSTCSGSTTYCTTCSDSSKLSLNGTCISGSSCPAGYFSSGNSTCIACHPDCETCGTSFDHCLTCPSSRPVLSSSNTCLQTCSSTEYYDNAKGACVACSSECATCSGADSGSCLSCSSTTTLKQGTCVSAGCTVVDGFGVCLSSLVTVAAQSVAEETKKKTTIPWWLILVIILGALALLAIGVYFWRKKEQKRRRLQTARFANDLGKKEVDLKLKELPHNIAYPPLPRAEPDEEDVPLTPRFVIEDNRLAPSPKSSRWSISSYGSNAKSLKPQNTGVSAFSGASGYSGKSFTSANGKKIVLGDRNPFRK